MRRLVYRVQPLPQSMLPLVWDFGQLNTEVEEMYIRQMVLRYVSLNLLYTRSLKGEGGILFYLCPSVQDIFRRIFLSNC